jgi:hypothetical protein
MPPLPQQLHAELLGDNGELEDSSRFQRSDRPANCCSGRRKPRRGLTSSTPAAATGGKLSAKAAGTAIAALTIA